MFSSVADTTAARTRSRVAKSPSRSRHRTFLGGYRRPQTPRQGHSPWTPSTQAHSARAGQGLGPWTLDPPGPGSRFAPLGTAGWRGDGA